LHSPFFSADPLSMEKNPKLLFKPVKSMPIRFWVGTNKTNDSIR
jgi:hypothetical protein